MDTNDEVFLLQTKSGARVIHIQWGSVVHDILSDSSSGGNSRLVYCGRVSRSTNEHTTSSNRSQHPQRLHLPPMPSIGISPKIAGHLRGFFEQLYEVPLALERLVERGSQRDLLEWETFGRPAVDDG